jgi:hypothetical protein
VSVADATTGGGLLAAGMFGGLGMVLTTILIVAIAAALYERVMIEAAIPLPSDDVSAPDDRSEGFVPLKPGRHPSQPRGSAVIPPIPNDPWRRAHSRLQGATNLREAASDLLEVEAEIRRVRRRDQYLAALYTNERSKARTSIVRRELAVVMLLAVGGMIAVWGVR